jgi:hypothetical protein
LGAEVETRIKEPPRPHRFLKRGRERGQSGRERERETNNEENFKKKHTNENFALLPKRIDGRGACWDFNASQPEERMHELTDWRGHFGTISPAGSPNSP